MFGVILFDRIVFLLVIDCGFLGGDYIIYYLNRVIYESERGYF